MRCQVICTRGDIVCPSQKALRLYRTIYNTRFLLATPIVNMEQHDFGTVLRVIITFIVIRSAIANFLLSIFNGAKIKMKLIMVVHSVCSWLI